MLIISSNSVLLFRSSFNLTHFSLKERKKERKIDKDIDQ